MGSIAEMIHSNVVYQSRLDHNQSPHKTLDSITSKIPEWKIRAHQKRDIQLSRIPPAWRIETPNPLPRNSRSYLDSHPLLTSSEQSITASISASELLSRISSGSLTSVEVTTAFCKRAALAQQLINCCTEMFFDMALEQAEYLDGFLAREGRTVGPLHGLPVSLKDVFDIKGQDSTTGWVSLIGQPAQCDSTIASSLRSQGAVLYVKSNVSQSLMVSNTTNYSIKRHLRAKSPLTDIFAASPNSLESAFGSDSKIHIQMSDSYNHIFKQSRNALDSNLISGGSSGGEGALIGCHGSIVGVGTDIGGSIRIPANLQGLYGLSPSVGRVPYGESVARRHIVNPVAGPIAQSIDAIEVFMKGLLAAQPWKSDVSCLPIPWREELAATPMKKLRIGYYVDDGVVKIQPPIQRAMEEVVEILKGAGHEVIEWDISSHGAAYRMWLKAILGDGGRHVGQMLAASDEPLVEGMLIGGKNDELSMEDIEELSDARIAYTDEYLARWDNAGIDALIMPVQPWVGFQPKTWFKSSQYVGYTAHWNFVNFAAISIPATKVKPGEDGGPDWESHGKMTRNESDRFNWAQYDSEMVEGMPVCVQVVGGRFGEEKCIAVAKLVEDLIREGGTTRKEA